MPGRKRFLILSALVVALIGAVVGSAALTPDRDADGQPTDLARAADTEAAPPDSAQPAAGNDCLSCLFAQGECQKVGDPCGGTTPCGRCRICPTNNNWICWHP